MTDVETRPRFVAWKGSVLVDPAPVARALQAAKAAGISYPEIARAARKHRSDVFHYANGRFPRMMASTADAICDAVEYLLEQRSNRLTAARKALRAAHPAPPDDRTWPSAALTEYCERHHIAVNGSIPDADRRQLYRAEVLSTARADRVCDALAVNPENIWPEWWHL